VAATNGHRSKLSVEQLGFVGFVPEHDGDADVGHAGRAWIPAGSRVPAVDKEPEAYERLRDIAPGWYALARRLVEDDKS
jgi:hypothetical protein